MPNNLNRSARQYQEYIAISYNRLRKHSTISHGSTVIIKDIIALAGYLGCALFVGSTYPLTC
jgi:hypothetical protein